MIFELYIKDFILIDELKINFSDKFNIFTGETGAGKSIIFNAINLLIGSKASKEYIRIGKERTIILGAFTNTVRTNKTLDQYGIGIDEHLVITREIHSNGKNISRINNQIVNLSVIKHIGGLILDVHGQHEQYSLLNSEKHMELIDNFGKSRIGPALKKVNEIYAEIKEIDALLIEIKNKNKEKDKRVDYISFQIAEIEKANLLIGEDDELEKKFELMNKSGGIIETLGSIIDFLSNNNDTSALDLLSEFTTKLSEIKDLDTRIDSIFKSVEEAFYSLEDVVYSSENVISDIEYSEKEFFEIEKRLDEINSIKIKYGNTIEEVSNFKDELQSELDFYSEIDSEIEKLNLKREELSKIYISQAKVLSDLRRKYSKKFEGKLISELKELNMKEIQFEVIIKEKNGIFINGIDDLEFYISTNLGQPLRQMAKIISGGELSRIMLAVKIINNDFDDSSTLVLDEIDTGISGETAKIVGKKISSVSKNNQILCVTHLPQIAVFADRHFKLMKQNDSKKTSSNVVMLNKEESVIEIGRMIGGENLDLNVKNTVIKMINDAQEGKEGDEIVEKSSIDRR